MILRGKTNVPWLRIMSIHTHPYPKSGEVTIEEEAEEEVEEEPSQHLFWVGQFQEKSHEEGSFPIRNNAMSFNIRLSGKLNVTWHHRWALLKNYKRKWKMKPRDSISMGLSLIEHMIMRVKKTQTSVKSSINYQMQLLTAWWENKKGKSLKEKWILVEKAYAIYNKLFKFLVSRKYWKKQLLIACQHAICIIYT